MSAPYVPLFQEAEPSPFWMLVGCILVNRTRGEQARPVLAALRQRWPNPWPLAKASPQKVEALLRPLGLSSARARSIVGLARAWKGIENPRKATAADVLAWPGCGRYAADSWAIFVEKRRDVSPTDKRLREFLAHEAAS